MPKKLRIGFIGTGGIAGAHLSAWAKVADAEVVALCDICEAALNATAQRFNVPTEHCYADYRRMLDSEKLDIVDVCTPNSAHAKPSIAALQAGCHVLVEKPVATSAREVEQMIQAGKDAGQLLMVAQVMRFSQEGQILKNWIDQGLVGDIYWGRAEYLRVRGVPAWGGFIDKAASAGGPAYDIGVHVLDLALHLMDFPEPVSVSAATYLKLANAPSLMRHSPRKYTVPEDFAWGLIRFADDRTLSLGASWALNLPDQLNQVTLCGTKGGVQLWPPTLVHEENGILANSTSQTSVYDDADSFYLECQAFAEAVRKGGPSPVPGEQALITQRILDAVYKSGQRGREVKV